MSFFDEMAKETMGKDRLPKLNRDHTYHVQISNYEPAFQTRQHGAATIFEFTVLSSSCAEHPAGTRLSMMLFHSAESAKGNVAKLLRSALGVPNTPEGKAYYESSIQPHLASYAQDPRYFLGKQITIVTETRIGQKSREEYVHFSPEPLRVNAQGGLDPLALRETKPALPPKQQRAGYGYPAAPPGYPAAPPGYPAAPPGYPAAPPGYPAPFDPSKT